MPRVMMPMYIPNSDFQAPNLDVLLPHFLVLHRMMRKTLAPRIGYLEAIPAYERNLLDALIKPVRFDVFEYIVDEIWNIATNPLRSCGFAPYIQHMIEVVAHEKFFKDVLHDSLCPVVPKDPRVPRASSSTPTTAPSCTTRSAGASSTPSANSSFLMMFRGIFAMCRCMGQCIGVAAGMSWSRTCRLLGATWRLSIASRMRPFLSSPMSLSSHPSSTPMPH
jgi:hypothetical protein